MCLRPTTCTCLASLQSRPRLPNASAYPCAGDRVRFEVIKGGGVGDDGPARREPWLYAWVDSVTTDDDNLAERAET